MHQDGPDAGNLGRLQGAQHGIPQQSWTDRQGDLPVLSAHRPTLSGSRCVEGVCSHREIILAVIVSTHG